MISLQGPSAIDILENIIESGYLPQNEKNTLSNVQIMGEKVIISNTGYTGEPIGYELFIERASDIDIWDLILEKGAHPIGLGARDTMRLEASLPLFGHELGLDYEGNEIPIFSARQAQYAVSFKESKGDYIGRNAL